MNKELLLQIAESVGATHKQTSDMNYDSGFRDISPTMEQIEMGRAIASDLVSANVQYKMNGLGGCKEFNAEDYNPYYRDLILKYIKDEICSVEAIYSAMERMKL